MAENKPAYTIGGRPNASEIGKAIEPLATAVFGNDVRGFASFHKKISKAIAQLDDDVKAEMPWARN